MRELSVEELLDGCRAALANAHELVDEAELLLKNGHYARAYFHAHIACEEMAKSPMLYRAACELALELSPAWERLDRRTRDHSAKIENVLTMDYLHSEIRPDNSDFRKYEEDLARIPLHNQAKNDSLYAGLGEHGFVRPAARFDRQGAEALVRLARTRLQVFDKPLPNSRDELSEQLQGPAGNVVREAFYTDDVEGLAESADAAENKSKRDDE